MDEKGNQVKQKDEFGPIFSRLYSVFASRSGKHRAVYTRIADDITALNPSSVLEIGCGPGITSAMIAEKIPSAKIVCIDPSSTMVKIARKRFQKMSVEKNVSCTIGDSEATGLTGAFDVIFTSLSFHHWKNGIQDVERLIVNHMPRGEFVIYENLVSKSTKNGKPVHSHGITMDFVDEVEIPGVLKSYEIKGELIALKFSNTSTIGAETCLQP